MSYVFTHRDMEDTENIKFVSDSPVSLIHRLKMEEGKDIWICGGASVVSQLMRESLIDRFHIAIIPTLLGTGVRLFDTIIFMWNISVFFRKQEIGDMGLERWTF